MCWYRNACTDLVKMLLSLSKKELRKLSLEKADTEDGNLPWSQCNLPMWGHDRWLKDFARDLWQRCCL